MLVNCSLCGGENEVHPGQEMLFCSYCGNSLALEKSGGPEHLILPHERNDGVAAEALGSFLAERRRARPRDVKVDFSYVPWLMVEDDRGRLFGQPGRKAPPEAGPVPLVPAGEYRFFEEEHAGGETVVPIDEDDIDDLPVRRILHLPLYRISYRAGGGRHKALVFGESLHVVAEGLPPARPAAPGFGNLLAVSAIFAALLLIGRLGHSTAARAVVIAAASFAGWAGMTLRERLAGEDG